MGLKNWRKRIDNNPSCGYTYMVRGSAGIGRQARLRGVCASVWVQVPSAAPRKNDYPTGQSFFVGQGFRRDLKPRPPCFTAGKTPLCRRFERQALRAKTAIWRVWSRAKKSHLLFRKYSRIQRGLLNYLLSRIFPFILDSLLISLCNSNIVFSQEIIRCSIDKIFWLIVWMLFSIFVFLYEVGIPTLFIYLNNLKLLNFELKYENASFGVIGTANIKTIKK